MFPTPFTDDGDEIDPDDIRKNTLALERHETLLLVPYGGLSEYYSDLFPIEDTTQFP